MHSLCSYTLLLVLVCFLELCSFCDLSYKTISHMLDDKQREFISDVVREIKFLFPYVSDAIAVLIGCQFALESAFGTSALARNYNNFCGMKSPKLRVTTASDVSCEFAHYNSLSDCLHDYFLCLASHHFDRRISTPLEFSFALSWYCPDKRYFTNILKLFKMYQS